MNQSLDKHSMDILLNNILLEETYSITKDEIDNVIQNQRKSKIALRKNLLLAYHIVAASVVSIGILDVLSDLQGYRQVINNIPIYLSYMVLSLIYFAVCIYKITVLNPVMNTPTQTIKTIKQLSVMLWVEFSSIVIAFPLFLWNTFDTYTWKIGVFLVLLLIALLRIKVLIRILNKFKNN